MANTKRTTLSIYDIKGGLVRTLVDEPLVRGNHDIHWDGMNDSGERVASGMYFYRLRAGKEIFTKKMTLLK
jgi:flagellar hook assembly protein FlgD